MEATATDPILILAIVITALGCLLCLGLLFLLVRGKALPPDTTQPHRIAFKGLEVQTSQIVMLLIVSLVAVLLPFTVYNWRAIEQIKFDREAKQMELNREDKRESKGARIKVYGNLVEKESGLAASDQDFEASLFKLEQQEEQPDKEHVISGWKNLINGGYDFSGQATSLDDIFELRIRRKKDQGKIVTHKVIYLNEFNFDLYLPK